jgi:periplasmic protein TonB
MQTQHILFVDGAEAAVEERTHVVLPPPKVEPLHEVFAEAMLEDTSSHQRRSPFDWVAAIGVHFAILATLLILPLYFTAGLDFHKLNLTFLATPAMPAAPPPPPMASASARPARVVPSRIFTGGKLVAPSFIPKAILTGPSVAAAPPDDSLMGVPGGVPGGQLGGVLGGVLGGAMKGVPPPAPVAAAPKVPVRVGGDVKPPRLLFGPAPDYPLLAKQAHIGGIVVIEAVIDERGNVTGMRVVSGHPLLVQSALNAVSKRKYEPTVLDGEPTPIDLRVEVTFSFS